MIPFLKIVSGILICIVGVWLVAVLFKQPVILMLPIILGLFGASLVGTGIEQSLRETRGTIWALAFFTALAAGICALIFLPGIWHPAAIIGAVIVCIVVVVFSVPGWIRATNS